MKDGIMRAVEYLDGPGWPHKTKTLLVNFQSAYRGSSLSRVATLSAERKKKEEKTAEHKGQNNWVPVLWADYLFFYCTLNFTSSPNVGCFPDSIADVGKWSLEEFYFFQGFF
eukprot:6038762-Amphidinium_carterae.1